MTIFERYVFRQAGSALLIILLSLSSIVWVALALRQLNVVTSQGQDVWMLIKMTTLALPNLMAIIAPFSLLIASIHTLNRLNGDSELIVLTASGATVWRAAKPLLTLALLVALGVAFVNHLAMPWSLKLLRQYIVQVRANILTQVIQPGAFSSPEQGLTFHIRERAPSGELLGLIVHDTRNKELNQSYLAERGLIVEHDPSNFLVMSKGHIVRRTDKDEPAQIIAFEKYAVDLDQFEKKLSEDEDLKPRERYLSELLYPEPTSNSYRSAPGKFRAELHERFSSPLYPIAFALIALAAVGQAHSTRQNRVQQVAIAFVLAAALRLGGLALNNIVVLNAAAAPLLYALPLVAMLGALTLMERARRRLTTSRFPGLIFDPIVDGFARLADLVRRWRVGRRAATGGRR
ncbi:MAG: LPS export ABC transporter permease LptF [Hyphomicrobium sp.]|uniref:LPS export ABC transporter permease LptF n=1 Tax=Hyphomicrobium sp. TaxID=82 RepID=UPI001329F510|nr:LPS export ABC transporter permease LptF [Hyphomicrobium sp.]KAB2939683.1 MAG: LPS export ABC transporter permease LptF [Hyphomicrobium sp.]MBZ0208040.1 LPS export ABC transporter permease LptF [Hyphomicrobium sp.]MCZ7593605.1 LPS export ABC transporter permease LptF [Hyphomicrobium sp.]